MRLAVALLVPLAACATANSLPSGLSKLTATDLQTAAQIATQNGDTVGAQCYIWLGVQLATLQGQPTIVPTGVASAFENTRVGVRSAEGGILSPTQRTALEMNCGPLFMSVQGDMAGLLAIFGVRATGL